MNHRRVQRTLFRMHFDEAFAERVHRGEEAALEGLDEAERSLLRQADPVAVSADREGRRRTQALGNILKEFLLTASAADAAGEGLGTGFFSSRHFHDAVMADRRLPLAFAEFAAGQVKGWGRPEIEALLELEGGMVRARRASASREEPRADEYVLAPQASLLEVRAGTVDFAAAWRARLAGDAEVLRTVAVPRPATSELLLLKRRPVNSVFAIPEVDVEVLQENVVPIFRAAETPLGAAERQVLAEAAGASREDLDGFLDSFVEEGSLKKGH